MWGMKTTPGPYKLYSTVYFQAGRLFIKVLSYFWCLGVAGKGLGPHEIPGTPITPPLIGIAACPCNRLRLQLRQGKLGHSMRAGMSGGTANSGRA